VISLPAELLAALIDSCVGALPRKAYGLVGGADALHPRSIYPCRSNLRNTAEASPIFESFGEFYRDTDRGFVIAAEEVHAITARMAQRGETLVGIFHSHRCRDAHPSELDIAVHVSPAVLSYIVSVLCPATPDVRIYRIDGEHTGELPYCVAGAAGPRARPAPGSCAHPRSHGSSRAISSR
jgi:proteasome lid subunit RPN8/RPN11